MNDYAIYDEDKWPEKGGDAGGLTLRCRIEYMARYSVDAPSTASFGPYDTHEILHAHQASIDPQTYVDSLGWKRLVSYQPAGRFWTFQLLEAGLFCGLAVAILAAAVWLVRRAPA